MSSLERTDEDEEEEESAPSPRRMFDKIHREAKENQQNKQKVNDTAAFDEKEIELAGHSEKILGQLDTRGYGSKDERQDLIEKLTGRHYPD